jgi:hypothetical protein
MKGSLKTTEERTQGVVRRRLSTGEEGGRLGLVKGFL